MSNKNQILHENLCSIIVEPYVYLVTNKVTGHFYVGRQSLLDKIIGFNYFTGSVAKHELAVWFRESFSLVSETFSDWEISILYQGTDYEKVELEEIDKRGIYHKDKNPLSLNFHNTKNFISFGPMTEKQKQKLRKPKKNKSKYKHSREWIEERVKLLTASRKSPRFSKMKKSKEVIEAATARLPKMDCTGYKWINNGEKQILLLPTSDEFLKLISEGWVLGMLKYTLLTNGEYTRRVTTLDYNKNKDSYAKLGFVEGHTYKRK